MKKTGRYIFYIFTIFTCVIILILAIYYSFIVEKPNGKVNVAGEEQNRVHTVDIQTTKEEFENEFNNMFNKGEFDDSTIAKLDGEKDIIYLANSEDGIAPSYKIDSNGKNFTAYIPMFNIDNEIAKGYNERINALIQTLNGFLSDDSQNFQGSMTFSANIVNNVLSVGIKVDYKVGYDAQKTIYQTYNYNLSTGTNIGIMDIVNEKGLNTTDVNTKIKETVSQIAMDSQAIQGSGYEVYQRDPSLPIYDITSQEAATNLLFILGRKGTLYIVYAYGNQNSTQEYDVIKF